MEKLDVCSTEYPAQFFLEVKYEEKVWGEDLYGGRQKTRDWVGRRGLDIG